MSCARCQGEGQVVTYGGRPLWLGVTLGRDRIREITRGEHRETMMRFVDTCSADDRRRVLRLLRDCQTDIKAFLPTTCPDCEGDDK